MSCYVQLVGPVSVRVGGQVIAPTALSGALGRMVLFRLSQSRGPVSRDALIDALWGDEVPPSVESVLNSTFSRLRSGMSAIGLDGKQILVAQSGSVAIRWPSDARIDLHTVVLFIEKAESALRDRDAVQAIKYANTTYAISSREILPGVDRVWLDEDRRRLSQINERTMEVLIDAHFHLGAKRLTMTMSHEFHQKYPYSMSAIQKLLRAYISFDDIPSALLAKTMYEQRLKRDLGITNFAELDRWFSDATSARTIPSS